MSIVSSEERHPWDPEAEVIYLLRKTHTVQSLINEIGVWSLFETSIPGLDCPPTVMLLQGVFIVANDNMLKLQNLLTTYDLSSYDRTMLEILFDKGSEHFTDLTILLLKFENEVPLHFTLSFSTFKEKVLSKIRTDGRVESLTARVYEFNKAVDEFGKVMEERNESNGEEQQNENDEEQNKHNKEQNENDEKRNKDNDEDNEVRNQEESENNDFDKGKDSFDDEYENKSDRELKWLDELLISDERETHDIEK